MEDLTLPTCESCPGSPSSAAVGLRQPAPHPAQSAGARPGSPVRYFFRNDSFGDAQKDSRRSNLLRYKTSPVLVLPGRTACQNLQGQKSELPSPCTGAVKPAGPCVLLRKEDSLEYLYMKSGGGGLWNNSWESMRGKVNNQVGGGTNMDVFEGPEREQGFIRVVSECWPYV